MAGGEGNAQGSLERLRAAIDAADALLILAGAGMGVDSGIGTFRGRAAGEWPGMARWGPLPPAPDGSTGLSQLNCAKWFDERPAMAWEFWRWCYESYSRAVPHAGYHAVARVAERKPTFVVTTNIDGHFTRAGVGAAGVREVHGSAMRVKCSGFGRPTSGPKALGDGEMDLRPLDFLEADDFDDDEFTDREPCGYTAPLADHPDARAFLARDDTALGVEAAVDDPEAVLRCECGAVLRPDVLLFGDVAWPSNPPPGKLRDELEAYQRFLATHLPAVGGCREEGGGDGDLDVPHPRLVVLEIGAGTQFPTLRNLARELAEGHPGVVHARVNPDEAATDGIAPNSRSVCYSVPLGAAAFLEGVL